MKTKEEVLEMASHEQIKAFADLADVERETDRNLADASDMACVALLAVRDAVNRGGKPQFRWAMMARLCGEHLERVLRNL